MVKHLPRWLLSCAALLLAFDAVFHASGFYQIEAAVAASGLAPFVGNAFKAVWLSEAAMFAVLAAVFGCIAVRPSAATRAVILLLALLPAVSAVLIYAFVGAFVGAHILVAASVAAFLGGLQYPASK